MKLYFVLLMKSHLQSYPCPLQINSFWNLGFLLGITIILQIITGIFLGLHYTSDLNSAYSSIFFFIREIYYGWCLRYLHFEFLFLIFCITNEISFTIISLSSSEKLEFELEDFWGLYLLLSRDWRIYRVKPIDRKY